MDSHTAVTVGLLVAIAVSALGVYLIARGSGIAKDARAPVGEYIPRRRTTYEVGKAVRLELTANGKSSAGFSHEPGNV